MEVIINHNDNSLTLKGENTVIYKLKNDGNFDNFTLFLEEVFTELCGARVVLSVSLITINEDVENVVAEW